MPYNAEWLVIWNLALQICFTTVYGRRITQFIYITLSCWTANNTVSLFFNVYVGLWLTQVTFSKVNIISFITWICLLNICFYSKMECVALLPKSHNESFQFIFAEEYQKCFDLNFEWALQDITTEEGCYVLETFCHRMLKYLKYFPDVYVYYIIYIYNI